MNWNEFRRRLYLTLNPLLITFFIDGLIAYLWQQLELVYMGYINTNPVDSIIGLIHLPFIYSWAKRNCERDLGDG